MEEQKSCRRSGTISDVPKNWQNNLIMLFGKTLIQDRAQSTKIRATMRQIWKYNGQIRENISGEERMKLKTEYIS